MTDKTIKGKEFNSFPFVVIIILLVSGKKITTNIFDCQLIH